MKKTFELKSHVLRIQCSWGEVVIPAEDHIDPSTAVQIDGAKEKLSGIGSDFWFCVDEENNIFAPTHTIVGCKIDSHVTSVVEAEASETGWVITEKD